MSSQNVALSGMELWEVCRVQEMETQAIQRERNNAVILCIHKLPFTIENVKKWNRHMRRLKITFQNVLYQTCPSVCIIELHYYAHRQWDQYVETNQCVIIYYE